MKNSIFTIVNRSRNLPAFSALPKPTAPRHVPFKFIQNQNCRAARLVQFGSARTSGTGSDQDITQVLFAVLS
jgi:hypothetical protein